MAEMRHLRKLARSMLFSRHTANMRTNIQRQSSGRPNMTRYTSFDFRNSVLAIVATILVSTSSLFFAAGPIGQANAQTVQTQSAYPLA
jgi:hypothetical protein